MTRIFIHGLQSSSRGTKARYFQEHFSGMLTPDFAGNLSARMDQLADITAHLVDIILVGSSFGGLMAAIFAMENPDRVCRLILLAPALNFDDFIPYSKQKNSFPVWLYIGEKDTITPPALVVPQAKKVFPRLHVEVVDDDHLLRRIFPIIDWSSLLAETEELIVTPR